MPRESENAKDEKEFSTDEELREALLEHCRKLLRQFRPRLDPDKVRALVESDMLVFRRDARALRTLRKLASALHLLRDEDAAPIDLRERGSVYRSKHAAIVSTIRPEAEALATTLIREMGKTIYLSTSGAPRDLDDKRLWNPGKSCLHEAVIARFTIDGAECPTEPWAAGPPATEEFLAAVSLLAGSAPCIQKRSRTVRAAMAREVAAIKMLGARLDRRIKVRTPR